MFALDDVVAVVTGAGQGVGAEIARALAAQGAAVAVNDLHAPRAAATVERICAAGGRAVAVPGDVTDRAHVADLVARVGRSLGPPTVLVNNAGVPASGLAARPFVEDDPAAWRPIVDLNLYGVLHCCQAVLPGMVAAGRGRIVTVVSDAGRVGERGIAVYAGAKAGAIGFSKALAKEVGPAGITVNCVSLGYIDPGGPAQEDPEVLARRVRRYPMGRFGRADDVAPAVVWLASEEAGFVTGQTVSVSGGYVIA